MSRASVYVFASLISSVSAALILTGSPSHTHARGIPHDVKREQSVYNDCRASSCQVAYLNSLEDFCLWAPSRPELDLSVTRSTEHTLTAWCMKSTHGTRLIPDGTISWAHFVKTPEFIQITGIGNLTNINAPADGVASANGEDSRVPGLVLTSAYGQPEQIYEWMSFVSQERFCFRACNPSETACPWIHDVFGCSENVSGNHDSGVFEDCMEDTKETPSTLYQEDLAVPSHYSANPPSGCTVRRTIGNGRAARARRALSSTSSSSTPLTSSTATSTESATTITFPSFPTSTSNATTLMNSTTPTSPAPTSTSHSFNHTSHPHRHSRSPHHFTTSPASVSSHSSVAYSSSSSSPSDPPSMSAALSPTSLTSTYSSDPPPVTSTSSVTSTSTSTDPPSTPTSISTSSSSSHRTSSPVSGLSQPSSSPSPSSPSLTPSTTTPSTSSTTPLSTSSTTTPSTSSTTPPPTSSPTPSQSSVILGFATPSPSSETTATSSSTFRNTATQLGSQCPPVRRDVVDAGTTTPPPSLLICLFLTIILSTFVGVFSI